jgi:hypothetical protein
MELSAFFDSAWKRYSRLTPDAPRVHELLRKRGERIINDHVAFRTFNLPGIGRKDLGRVFEKWGYRAEGDLEFKEKKLLATYWIHEDASLPKIFVSELLLERCSKELQDWVRSFALASGPIREEGALLEPSWAPIRHEEYERFYAESEYAAWTAAFGIQVNHFTVFVNALSTFATLGELNGFLVENGFNLNASGGAIKGTPDECLEQSSTMARRIPWQFGSGVTREVLGCYYEFARRYPVPGTDRLFQGFVPASADKIFESTFEKKPRKPSRS